MLWKEDGEEEDRECCGRRMGRRKIGSAVGEDGEEEVESAVGGGWGGGR